jgi:hypothetical protein
MTAGRATQLVKQRSQLVQFRSELSPVSVSQLLDRAIVPAESLARAIGLGVGGCASGRRWTDTNGSPQRVSDDRGFLGEN